MMQFFNAGAVGSIHAVQAVVIVVVGKVDNAVVFAEQTAVVEVAGGVAKHRSVVLLCNLVQCRQNDEKNNKTDKYNR